MPNVHLTPGFSLRYIRVHGHQLGQSTRGSMVQYGSQRGDHLLGESSRKHEACYNKLIHISACPRYESFSWPCSRPCR
jgi:hypothetical protein